jgi:hypothetical protein
LYNLAFSADHVIRRKHTVRAKRELPALLADIIQPLKVQRLAQNQRLLTYQGADLTDIAQLSKHYSSYWTRLKMEPLIGSIPTSSLLENSDQNAICATIESEVAVS